MFEKKKEKKVMKKSLMSVAVCVLFVIATAVASFAAMGEGTVTANKGVDIRLFGSNRLIPSYYRNFDFNDDAKDEVILTEGGFGAGFFVRNELRLGWKGTGQDGKWGFKVILENDIHMTKDNGDRNTYVGYGDKSSDFGGEFSVERSNFWYKFGNVKFSSGWDVKFLDIKTGGLVYGDDHPFMALTGGDKNLNWDLCMLLIKDTDDLQDGFYKPGNAPNDFDWYVYYAKVNFKAGDFTISPFVAYSDLGSAVANGNDTDAIYYGVEGYGSFGMFKPSFEIAGVTGTINDSDPTGDDVDIQSWAAFAGLTLALSPELNPYITATYQQGDDDYGDDDAEGFVGITNIARYTPYGIDNAILYEHFGGGNGYGGPLYALSNERINKGHYTYGGIGNGGSGENPGLLYLAGGLKGKVDKTSYNVRVSHLWYDEEDVVWNKKENKRGLDDNDMGWVFDAQIKYPLSPNLYVKATASYWVVGDDLEDAAGDDESPILTAVELGWKW